MALTRALSGYRDIADHLRGRISKGQWPVNASLPGRTELASEYGVARKTIDRAIGCLVDDGLVAASNRRGTFVKALSSQAMDGGDQPASSTLVGRTVGVICALDAELATAAYEAGRQPWDLSIVGEIETACSLRGGRTCFAPLPADGASERDAVAAAVEAVAAAGAEVVVCIQLYDSPTLLDVMRSTVTRRDLGLVLVAKGPLPDPVPHVFPDQHYAGYQAAEHLIAAGYERLVFLATITGTWVDERIEGARSAVAAAGLPTEAFTVAPRRVGERLRAEAQPSERAVLQRARQHARAIANARGGPTDAPGSWGVIAANDVIGFGAQDEFTRQGLTSGRDVGLIGFDDHMDARLRGMSSLRMPLIETGRAATELASGVLNRTQTSPQTRLLWQLAARASTDRTGPRAHRE